MKGAFRFDSKFYEIIEKVVSIVKLNVMWILFSVPVITMGAASCALHDTAEKIAKKEEGYICRNFLAVFKRKWKQTFMLWMLLLLAGAGLLIDFLFWRKVEGTLAEVMTGVLLMLMIVWIFLVTYAFPLAARVENNTKAMLRTALLLSVKYLPQSCYMLLWMGIFLAAGWLWTPVLFIEIMAGSAMMAIIQEKVLSKIFEQELK